MKVKLKDICSPKQWKTISTSELLEEGYPVFGANGIIGYYNEYNHEKETLCVTCRGATCGSLNITYPKSYINGNAMALDNLSKDIDIKYLYFYLKHRGFNDVISGSAQPQIIRSDIENIDINVIAFNEQKLLINKAEVIENLINLYETQLKSFDLLVKSRFVEMFGDGKYEIKKLKDVSNLITDGTHITPNYLLDGIKFISAKNIVNGKINFDDIKYISEEEYNKIQNRCKVEKNDVLLTKSGTLGSCAVVDIDDKIGLFESLAIIKYKREIINPIYLCEMIKSDNVQSQFKQNEKGLAVKHLHLNVIKDIDIMVPPIELQESYASFVAQVDKSKFAVQKALEKTKMLMDSLMQEYFG